MSPDYPRGEGGGGGLFGQGLDFGQKWFAVLFIKKGGVPFFLTPPPSTR